MGVRVDRESDCIVPGIDDGDALNAVVLSERRAFIKQSSSGLVEPLSQDDVQRVTPSFQVNLSVVIFCGINKASAAKRDFINLIADSELNDVALFSQFHPLFIRPLPKAPEDRAAFRSLVVKASRATFVLSVLQIQIGLATESLDHAVQYGACFLLITICRFCGRRRLLRG